MEISVKTNNQNIPSFTGSSLLSGVFIPSTITEKQAMESIEELTEKKLQADDKFRSIWLKELVYENRLTWWEEYHKLRQSKNPEDRRLAFIEFNKLNCRILPTQLEAADGGGVSVNLINWNGNVNKETK